MYRRALCIFFVVAAVFTAFANGTGVCTGYPKTYNGKPCASTTRYWDGQMGACGCGSGNTSPFSWQWSKPTAAASAPIYGSGTWCGSGCGKCFKLTPTAIGASPVGKGATNLNSLVVKVTNLCPSGGNEEWCSMDVNSHDYDAHFDLMDENMAGIITAQGWDNPEVTYEEVDCAANGFGDWSCQCASAPALGGGSSSNSGTTTPVTTTTAASKPSKTTAAPTAAATSKATTSSTSTTTTTTTTNAPANPPSSDGLSLKVRVFSGVNEYWFAFSVADKDLFESIEVSDKSGSFKTLTYEGDQYWGMFYTNPSSALQLPLSLRFTSKDGTTVTASDIITSFTAGEVDTRVGF